MKTVDPAPTRIQPGAAPQTARLGGSSRAGVYAKRLTGRGADRGLRVALWSVYGVVGALLFTLAVALLMHGTGSPSNGGGASQRALGTDDGQMGAPTTSPYDLSTATPTV